MRTTPLTIGAFGLGCVGQGFLELLDANGGSAHVKHICVKDRDRVRNAGTATITFDALEILQDEEVRVIVELTNDHHLALDVIRRGLRSGRSVVTANKRAVAENLGELIALQRETGQKLLYEASCAASIPVVRALELHYGGEDVRRIEGILNGTSNYVLTKVGEEGLAPADAVRQAQELGFAETDPTFDLDGTDARYKLVILLAHAFGTVVRPHEILRHGIEDLSASDVAFGRDQGWGIRCVANAYRSGNELVAYVLPRFMRSGDGLAQVRNEYNAVRIEGSYSGTHLLQGKGAGKLPTGLAVLSDVRALDARQGYGYAKVNASAPVLGGWEERLTVHARLPSTHQELLARFDHVGPLEERDGHLSVVGTVALGELHHMLGEGRPGFQVIELPHLSEQDR